MTTTVESDMDAKLRAAIELIKRGGTVVYPTETVYGLGADAFSEPAVRRVYALKRRELTKPISIAIASFEMLQAVAYVDAASLELLKALLPGPITVLLRKKECVPDLLTAGSDLIGIRFPDHEIALQLIRGTGPITTTSANISGQPPPARAEEVAIPADLLIDGGRCKYSLPSTVLALRSVAAAETEGKKGLTIEIEVKRRGAWYDRVLHVMRSKALGEGLHRFSVPELR